MLPITWSAPRTTAHGSSRCSAAASCAAGLVVPLPAPLPSTGSAESVRVHLRPGRSAFVMQSSVTATPALHAVNHRGTGAARKQDSGASTSAVQHQPHART